MSRPRKPKQAIGAKIEDHEEVIAKVLKRNLRLSNHFFFQKVLLLTSVMKKGCAELINILSSLESNKTFLKQKNYLQVMHIYSCIDPQIYSLCSLLFASTLERKTSVHWDSSIEFQSEFKGCAQYH